MADAFGARETLVASGILGAAVIGLAPFVFGLVREEPELGGTYDPARGV